MTRIQANALLLVAAMLWGFGNVAQQMVLAHIGPLLANGLKSAVAVLVICPLCLMETRRAPPLDRRGWMLALSVAVTFTFGTTLYQIGFGHTTVSNAGFLVNTSTVITPFFVWLTTRRQPSLLVWPSAIATCAGAAFMSGGTLSDLHAGDLICLMSAACFAAWMICLGEFVTRYERAGWITVMQFLFAAVACTSLAPVIETNSLQGVWAALPLLLFLGVASTGIGYVLQAFAQRRTSPSEAAVLVSAEALFGAAAAYVSLNEHMAVTGVIGACLIALGIVLVQISPATLEYFFSPQRRRASTRQVFKDLHTAIPDRA